MQPTPHPSRSHRGRAIAVTAVLAVATAVGAVITPKPTPPATMQTSQIATFKSDPAALERLSQTPPGDAAAFDPKVMTPYGVEGEDSEEDEQEEQRRRLVKPVQVQPPTPVESPSLESASPPTSFMAPLGTRSMLLAADPLAPTVDSADDLNNPAWFSGAADGNACPARSPAGPGQTLGPSNNIANRHETKVAAHNNLLFAVGNFFALKSADTGATWTCVDPSKDLIAAGGIFCCDQEALYDPVHNMWIWIRLDRTGGTVIWVSYQVGALSNTGWCHTKFTMSSFGQTPGPNSLIDGTHNPHLSATKLWMTGNVWADNGAFFGGIASLDLNQMATTSCGSAITGTFMTRTDMGNITTMSAPAFGTMVFASTPGPSNLIRVLKINETNMAVSGPTDVVAGFNWNTNASALPPEQPTGQCASWAPGGTGSWASARWHDSGGTDHLLVLINAGPSGPAPYGVLEVVQINLGSLAYEARSTLWSNKGCLNYPNMISNNGGDVGIEAQLGAPRLAQPPGLLVALNREIVPTSGVKTLRWESPLRIESTPGVLWESGDDNSGDWTGIDVVDGSGGTRFVASAAYYPSCTRNEGLNDLIRGCAHPMVVRFGRAG